MSRRISPKILLLVGAAVGAASPVHAQVRDVTLDKPNATLDHSMSAVSGVRELSDGRLVVSDPTEQAVSVVDFAAGTVTQIGRQGQGPGEYAMPSGLFALPGDSTLMVDRALQRLSVILPNGSISGNTRPMRGPNGWPLMLRGVDARGRFYFDLGGIAMPGLEETAALGVAPIYRWDPTSGALDSLGVVHFPPMPVAGGGPGQVRVTIGGGGPYRGRDEWAVTPDGRVAVARYQDYHVDWIHPDGRVTSGAPVRYTPVPITRAEKDAWADAMAQNGLMIQVENGRRRTMRPPRPDVDKLQWPEVMPPFLSGAVRVTPEGQVWVERAAPAKDKRETFDVFDGQGKLVRRVTLAPDRRLVGFGSGVLYAVRVDQDDLQWLERYAQ